ncbi:MAG: hypothetical protein V4574_08875 [Pseudomonadota bacterium]
MIRIGWSIAIAGALLAMPSPSRACRVYLAPAQRLAMGYDSGAISAVALVRITGAGYTGVRRGDAHPWRASATVRRLLRGSHTATSVGFERGWGSAACDDGRPPPKAGEVWVIYFWKRPDGEQAVWLTYPASVAFEADPRLRRR